jgi:hypothetical protein
MWMGRIYEISISHGTTSVVGGLESNLSDRGDPPATGDN